MSEVSERSSLSLHLADFAITDASGKVNALGMNVDILGFDSTQGVTNRFTVLAEVLVPSELCPVDFTVELLLLDSADQLVEVPGPAGPQKLRIGQPARLDRPGLLPNGGTTPSAVRSRQTTVMDFGNGLPLVPGNHYTWRLRIDGDDDNGRDLNFAVPGPPSMPVLG